MEPDKGDGQPDVVALVYDQLRACAQVQMNQERPGHTLTATALVHEAFMKVLPALGPKADPARFYRAAVEAMRRILIDHARRRGAVKRGGGGGGKWGCLDVHSVLDLASDEHVADALALDEAIVRLEGEDVEAAEVVRLRFFAGLTGDQAAGVLGISARQADRAWAFARAFLLQELRAEEA